MESTDKSLQMHVMMWIETIAHIRRHYFAVHPYFLFMPNMSLLEMTPCNLWTSLNMSLGFSLRSFDKTLPDPVVFLDCSAFCWFVTCGISHRLLTLLVGFIDRLCSVNLVLPRHLHYYFKVSTNLKTALPLKLAELQMQQSKVRLSFF